MNAPPPPGSNAVQKVTASAGFAYGVIGADLHVLGDGTPVYVLENYLGPGVADAHWLRELPSRLLSARNAVVAFTGRESERDDLQKWSQDGPRLAVRWLHAPGGQGKTRLAAQVAADLAGANWKVVTAAYGPGTALKVRESQDVRPNEEQGLLLIIDYADRWPVTHLSWLLSNALLHQAATPTRVLLLARTADAWPVLRDKLGNYQAGVSQQFLAPLPSEPGHRERAFVAARDSFSRHYGLADPGVIVPPAGLAEPEWGLILTVHMAALVAVDAHVHSREAPRDPAGLTGYLLDRERAHWTHLYENRARLDMRRPGVEFQTPRSVMSRAVFTAALTGPVAHHDGKAILDGLDLGLPAEQVLTDHAYCYPPADPRLGTVLEPLYPDRLAEDFLGLTMPGHTSSQPAYPWAPSTATALLTRDAQFAAPAYTPRAVTFLAAAAERWPHLGEMFLYPLLRQDAHLAIEAGAAALTALARLPGIPADILAAIELLFPRDRHVDLDPGIAVIVQRLAGERLATTKEPAERAKLWLNLGMRLANAGDHRPALEATEEGVGIFRGLAAANPGEFDAELAKSLTNLGWAELVLGRREEALAATQEAVELFQQLQRTAPAAFDAELATALTNLGQMQSQAGRQAEALRTLETAVALRRRLAAADPGAFAADLAKALASLGVAQSGLGRWEDALRTTEEAVALFRPLAAGNPSLFEPDLATSLGSLGNRKRGLGRWDEALAATQEAVQIWRRVAAANPAAFERDLATGLTNLGNDLSFLGRRAEALAATVEALELFRRLAVDNPEAVNPMLAMALNNLGVDLFRNGKPEEALTTTAEAVEIRRQLAEGDPATFEPGLALSLAGLGNYLSDVGRREEALAATAESAELYRRLAAANPGAYEHHLAATIDNLSADLVQAGRWEEAVPLSRESVGLYRRLVAGNPGAFEFELALSLSNFGHHMVILGQREEALAAIEETVAIFRRLAADNPAEHGPSLAVMLGNLGEARSAMGLREEALAAAEEAVDRSRQLVADHPSLFEAQLATALAGLGQARAALGLRAEALAAVEEAAQTFRRLAAARPGAFEEKLAASLNLLGKCLSDVDRRPEALAATREAVEILRRLAAASPAGFEPALASGLAGFAHMRAATRLELPEALAAARQAVAIYRRLSQVLGMPVTDELREANSTLADVLDELGQPQEAAAVRAETPEAVHTELADG